MFTNFGSDDDANSKEGVNDNSNSNSNSINKDKEKSKLNDNSFDSYNSSENTKTRKSSAMAIRSLIIRASYGGMKCDVAMLRKFAVVWNNRFKCSSGNSNNMNSSNHDNSNSNSNNNTTCAVDLNTLVIRSEILGLFGSDWEESEEETETEAESRSQLQQELRQKLIEMSVSNKWFDLIDFLSNYYANIEEYNQIDIRSIPFVTSDDLILSAVDFHCSNMLEHLLGSSGIDINGSSSNGGDGRNSNYNKQQRLHFGLNGKIVNQQQNLKGKNKNKKNKNENKRECLDILKSYLDSGQSLEYNRNNGYTCERLLRTMIWEFRSSLTNKYGLLMDDNDDKPEELRELFEKVKPFVNNYSKWFLVSKRYQW